MAKEKSGKEEEKSLQAKKRTKNKEEKKRMRGKEVTKSLFLGGIQ
jgi:hypothetical protein